MGKFVQRKRPVVDPNAAYRRQLEEWERRLAPLTNPRDVEEALSKWRGERETERALQAKHLLDKLFEELEQSLREPGHEDWGFLKAIDVFRHDIMNCVFPQ